MFAFQVWMAELHVYFIAGGTTSNTSKVSYFVAWGDDVIHVWVACWLVTKACPIRSVTMWIVAS